ncbi:recombinase family protein [Mesorhizobium hunchu]|uniref:recombinase family protein n=1 Tax=Mesorhizobium hunchu TaxID=3157708 RepID=UPI003CCCB12D
MTNHLLQDKPRRAAVYARFSTDLQNEKSAEDQIDLCRAFARREGFHVVQAYKDEAKSGASLHGRAGILSLLADANARKFDVVIVEALDRLSRDMADMATIYKQMQFLGIKIIAVHEGEANTLTVGMRAIFAQLFREDNVHKVRRGMGGKIKQGLSAGGKAYGYEPDPANRGKPRIVPDEAAIVLRIFEEYAKGTSPKAICHQLTREGVRPPRGEQWSPSALVGFKSRGTGILRNHIYVGKIVWNKVRMVKEPYTGKRLSRPNPPDKWHTAEAPELQIVPNDLFDAVQAQLVSRAHVAKEGRIGANNRPKRLLSGLLKCAACGSGMAVAGVDKSGRTRLRCSRHTNSRSCPDPKTYYLQGVEDLVISSLAQELATLERIEFYARRYIESRFKEDRDNHRRRADMQKRLAQIEAENMRLVKLMLQDGADTKTLGAITKENGQERDRIELELSRLPQGSNVILHPAAIKAFAKKLLARNSDPLRSNRAKLEMTMTALDDMGELGPIIRELIHSITLHKDDDGSIGIEVEGYLTPFLQKDGKPWTGHEPLGAVALVAEEGFEPPTQGL